MNSLAQVFDVPYHHISDKNKDGKEHEEKVKEVLERYQPDYIVLAKYMRIFTPEFVSRYKNRIINIHHSFLSGLYWGTTL